MINVGIIGSGFIVPVFIEATKAVKGYRYIAISSPHSVDKLRELKEKYNMNYYSLDYEDLLKDKNIDTVYIGTPNSTHYEIAKKALQNNKNVISDPNVIRPGQQLDLKNIID